MFQTQTMCDDFYSYHNYRPLIFEELDLGNYLRHVLKISLRIQNFSLSGSDTRGSGCEKSLARKVVPHPTPLREIMTIIHLLRF